MRPRALVFASLVPLLGCVGYPPPNLHLATSMASVQIARELGGYKVPFAELHIRLAEEEIVRAKALMKEGSNEKADYMTLRAYNDAELAITLTREVAARARADQAAEKARNAGVRP
jgi:hypothetical protein